VLDWSFVCLATCTERLNIDAYNIVDCSRYVHYVFRCLDDDQDNILHFEVHVAYYK